LIASTRCHPNFGAARSSATRLQGGIPFLEPARGSQVVGGTPRTLYLATPVQTCVAELERLARSQDVAVADLLAVPRLLHTIDVIDLPVLDLSTGEALAAAGLSAADIAADSWSRCQSVGHAAWFLELGGLRAPSASGHGEVIAVFEGRIDPGQLVLSKSEPLTFELYESLR